MMSVWIATLTIAAIALLAGLALSFASRKIPASDGDLDE